MRRERSLRILLLLTTLAVAGCAGVTPAGAAGPAPAPATPRDPSPPPSPPGPREPLDVTLAGARIVVRISGKKLASSRLLEPLRLLARATPVGDTLGQIKAACELDPLDVVDELVVSEAEDKELLFAARVSAPGDAVLSCIAKVTGGRAGATVAGRPAVVTGDGRAVVFVDGMLVGGTPSRVEVALATPASARTAPAVRLDESPDALVSVAMDPHDDPVDQLTATLTQTSGKLTLDLTAQTPSPDHASKLVAAVDEVKRRLIGEMRGDPSVSGFADTLASSLTVSSEGASLHASYGATGDLAAQMELVGRTSAAAAFAFRQYTARAKVGEARANLRALERAAISYAEQQATPGKPRGARFPASAPRTPAEIPHGTTATLRTEAWQAPGWKALHFAPDLPLRYAYSTTTSKDGKRIVLRAEGDLDADGKTSKLETTLVIKPDGSIELASGVVVVDELE